MIKERIIGAAVLLLGLILLFVLIPVGIDSPSKIEHASLSPEFWPRIISLIFTVMGVLIIFKPGVEDAEEIDEFDNWSSRIPRLAVVLVSLFTFYFVIENLGMVIPGMVIIFSMMWFAGERRWLLMGWLSASVPLLLYFFFVHVANIPIPLGIFEILRG